MGILYYNFIYIMDVHFLTSWLLIILKGVYRILGIRWRQRFDNFERSYNLLKKYSSQPINTELETRSLAY
uniref:Uncharacterized protein n=1 Tax=Virgibacillus oceani TaxID=1479511 RepID=A0A917HI59_9BACI|nr:hypothetical protein GCM10011398_26810 [Virgibacillus oceani]